MTTTEPPDGEGILPPSNGTPSYLSDRIEQRSPEDLKLPERLIQKYSPRLMNTAKRFIRKNGVVAPVVVSDDGEVAFDVLTVITARELKLPLIPTVRMTDLTPTQLREARLGYAKIWRDTEFDERALAFEFEDLEPSIDLDDTGFTVAERDFIIEQAAAINRSKDDVVPAVEAIAVSQAGDLWTFPGGHKVLVADARFAGNYQRLLGNNDAAIVCSDPPYGVPINGHVSGNGRIKHREFVCGGAEMSDLDFARFLRTVIRQMSAFTRSGGMIYLYIDWRHIETMLTVARQQGLILKNLAVWRKTVPGLGGGLYRSQHELVVVAQNGEGLATNNNRMGESDRHRSNVWDYPGANAMRRGRLEDLQDHPTVKPVAMIEEILRDCTRPGDIVLDPFLGSGTTLLACHRSRRIGYGMELDPLYGDVIVRRLKRLAGLDATLAATGESFEQVAARRAAEASAAA